MSLKTIKGMEMGILNGQMEKSIEEHGSMGNNTELEYTRIQRESRKKENG